MSGHETTVQTFILEDGEGEKEVRISWPPFFPTCHSSKASEHPPAVLQLQQQQQTFDSPSSGHCWRKRKKNGTRIGSQLLCVITFGRFVLKTIHVFFGRFSSSAMQQKAPISEETDSVLGYCPSFESRLSNCTYCEDRASVRWSAFFDGMDRLTQRGEEAEERNVFGLSCNSDDQPDRLGF